MQFFSKKLVKPQDLNPYQTLFGGALLGWIDEEAAIFAMSQIDSKNIVTKFMSEINFLSSARNGDIIEIGLEVIKFGRTSISVSCIARNVRTQINILSVEKIVLVNVDKNGVPIAHGKGPKNITI